MKKLLLATIILGAAGIAVSTTRHHTIAREACCDIPVCLPGDPSPPCPTPPPQ